MLTLRSSPSSPFVRKVRIASSVLALDGDIKVERADTSDPSDTVRRQNPLGKIPALLLEDGSVLFDSRVILEYLDQRAGGGRIIPKDPAARIAALRLQALADGIMDASILIVYEARWRPPDRHEPKWLDHQAVQGCARPRGARAEATRSRHAAERWSDRACLRPRLPRLPVR